MRALAVAVFATVASLGAAYPPFWETFQKHYRPANGSSLFKAKCATCHVPNNTKRNAYGRELMRLVRGSSDRTLTLAMLRQAEPSDADGDGASNGDEIQAGSLPGDPQVRPTVSAPAPGSPPAREAPEAPATPEGELIPKHSFHPLAVHFPIALFLFGGFLELVGKLRRLPELRRFAIWNLGFGAISSAVAMPTGVIAWLRLGFPFEGTLRTHFILASAATVLMIGLACWRVRRIHDSPLYWSLLAATCAAVAAAGHYGALLVYPG